MIVKKRKEKRSESGQRKIQEYLSRVLYSGLSLVVVAQVPQCNWWITFVMANNNLIVDLRS